MKILNFLAVSAPNEIENVHKIRFTPEDSTAKYLSELYNYDFMSPQLRRSSSRVAPVFLQKIAYTKNDLDLILSRGTAKRVTNIEFLYFTGHASNQHFSFYPSENATAKPTVEVSTKDVLRTLTGSDVRNIIVSGCDFLDADRREKFLKDCLRKWTGKLFIGLSSPPNLGPLWNRDIVSIISTIFCTIFDKYVYSGRSKIKKNLGELIQSRLTFVYSKEYLERCGISILWKPRNAKAFKYWDPDIS